MVETKTITDRRPLAFGSIDDALIDVERIVAADAAGKLRTTGNWTAGQAMGHVAAWINYAYDGFPISPPPWPIRMILRLVMKPRILRRGMPAGARIPGTKDGTLATDPLSTAEGAARLRQALARLRSSEEARYPSPAWGDMPKDERVAINLRHAELHLSFLHP